MKDYDYHRPAEKVLLDSYRKQNRNKNRLLFLAVALTVGAIFCMISFAYGKIQVDIQKHILKMVQKKWQDSCIRFPT